MRKKTLNHKLHKAPIDYQQTSASNGPSVKGAGSVGLYETHGGPKAAFGGFWHRIVVSDPRSTQFLEYARWSWGVGR